MPKIRSEVDCTLLLLLLAEKSDCATHHTPLTVGIEVILVLTLAWLSQRSILAFLCWISGSVWTVFSVSLSAAAVLWHLL